MFVAGTAVNNVSGKSDLLLFRIVPSIHRLEICHKGSDTFMMFLQGKVGAYWSKYACPITFWIEEPLNIIIRTTVVVVDADHTYESEEALCIRIRIWIDGDHGIRRLHEMTP